MYLIEIFLPTYDNAGNRFPKEMFHDVRGELAKRFGGVTAFMRSPAVGLWAEEQGELRRDDLVIFEVMSDAIEASWWRSYRLELEKIFHQEEIIVRATVCERL